jgi:hypothetical protein
VDKPEAAGRSSERRRFAPLADATRALARRVTKADESFHLALLGLLHGARVHVMTERFQRCGGVLQAGFILDLETDGLVARITFRIAQRVRALIGPEIKGVLPTLGDLQAEAEGGKGFRLLEIG